MTDIRKLEDEAARLAATGRLDEAVELYRRAAGADPKDLGTTRKLAEVLRRAGRIPEAVRAYREIADRYGQEGRLIAAIAVSKAILDLDPQHEETRSALAELHAQRPAAEGPAPQIPILSGLTRDAFVALTGRMVLRRVAQGEAVIREGEEGTSVYVVASGRLAVSRRIDGGGAVVLARLREGDFFGEMALLSGAPRSATVTAEQDCDVLEFPPGALVELAAQHPHLARSLRRFYRQRLLANAMATSPLFRPFQGADRRAVMERFRSRAVAAGEVVIREGEPSDGLYVVLEGAVDVVKHAVGGERAVGHLREGDLFGEMSCLRKAPASASVVVRRAGTLLRLPRADFDELVLSYPQILEVVAELSDERAGSLDAILSGRAQWTDDGLVLT